MRYIIPFLFVLFLNDRVSRTVRFRAELGRIVRREVVRGEGATAAG